MWEYIITAGIDLHLILGYLFLLGCGWYDEEMKFRRDDCYPIVALVDHYFTSSHHMLFRISGVLQFEEKGTEHFTQISL
jgi:hypothetical protein